MAAADSIVAGHRSIAWLALALLGAAAFATLFHDRRARALDLGRTGRGFGARAEYSVPMLAAARIAFAVLTRI